jgi:hypothetical protein
MGGELAVSIPGYAQVEGADTGVELTIAVAVAVPLAIWGSFVPLGAYMLAELHLQHLLVQSLHQIAQSVVAGLRRVDFLQPLP